MVTTTDSSSNHHSPTSAGAGISRTGDSNSPKFPRKNLSSPWAQVVRGGEQESISGIHQSPPSSSSSSSSLTTYVPDPTPSSDSSLKAATASPPVDNFNTSAADTSDGDNGIVGRTKKPAWNKPSNGAAEVGPVMGAVSWPALSESTKASAKMSADSSSKTVTDGSLSSSQGHITSNLPQKQATNNAKPNSSNYNRQRSVKRGVSNNIAAGPAQSSFSNPPPPPPPPAFPVFQVPLSGYGTVVPGVPDNSTRNWDTRPLVGSFVPAVNDHRSSSRRGNFGHHPRGDGPYHNNYGGRRDQDRGNMYQQRVPPRGLVRHPPPNTAAFVAPQVVGAPFANPIGFPEVYYVPTLPLEPFRGMPFFTHGPPPAMIYSVAEPPLANMIVNQIEYYFSEGNLVKDEFLRSNMDEQGWVPVTLIANFPRVKNLTSSIQLILDTLRTSSVVEVQGDKLRRRNEWIKWVPSARLRTDSGSLSPGGSGYNNLSVNIQNITLEEATTTTSMEPTAGAFTGRFPTESQLPNGDATRNSN